ncbi:putative Ribosome biogenesis protein MAK21 [Monocercomonoides exilis]|uniref:putative Ribosome biogenesis protein MAK21 n=1 Tax=Monocercomonoides exilis TaxID=2049356 RepID=UPI00355A307C|nr:putative Ribosome biogenesis protein MAK21 [Monocercomonoides exilis]
MRENKEKKWLNALIQKGTITDKLSGLTILGQSARDDEEGAKAVKQLISMMKRTDRRISGMAMQNLLQLFQVNLLPKNKELSVDDPKDAMIKELYASFIRAVSEKAKDTVLNSKNHAIKTLSEMAIMPEQRLSVLSELVNKLGDNVKSAASLTSHLIIILSKRRPAIKLLIVEEIERLVYRPNISQRAQFYGIVALNGFTLDPAKDASVANQMLKLYFSLFDDIFKRNEARHAAKLEESKKKKKNRWSQTKEHGKRGRKGKLLQKKKEMLDEAESTEQRLLFAVLSGIGRVMNIAGAENAAKFESHLNSLFRASHSHSFASSLRAMLLLHRLLSVQGILPDRYYNALYEKLSDPEMLVEKSQHPLFWVWYSNL